MSVTFNFIASGSALWQLECKIPVHLINTFVHLFEDWADSVFCDAEKDPEEAAAAGVILDPVLTLQASFFIEGAQVEQTHQEIIARLSIAALLNTIPIPEISFKKVPDTNWLALNYQDFPPLTIGRFFIHGSHIKKLEDPSTISLQIDASTAFGSGKHITTQSCLFLLDTLAKNYVFHHPLDMGCGSGILAVSMAATWNVNVTAVDIDPEAIRVTLKNAAINGLQNKITGIVSNGFINAQILDQSPFDLMTANILTVPLCDMANIAGRILQKGAKIILSGILTHQKNKVIEAYEKEDIQVVQILENNEWVTLFLEKPLN